MFILFFSSFPQCYLGPQKLQTIFWIEFCRYIYLMCIVSCSDTAFCVAVALPHAELTTLKSLVSHWNLLLLFVTFSCMFLQCWAHGFIQETGMSPSAFQNTWKPFVCSLQVCFIVLGSRQSKNRLTCQVAWCYKQTWSVSMSIVSFHHS